MCYKTSSFIYYLILRYIMPKQLIQKVCQNISNGQKIVTIPKSSEIEPGDYVQIKKIENE